MDESNDDDSTPSGPPRNRRRTRRTFSLQEKMSFLRRIRRRVENEQVSINEACRDANIHPKQYRDWSKNLNAMKDAKNIKAKSLCAGRVSILKPIEEHILKFIFEMREQGMAVTNSMVKFHAATLLREFGEKSEVAQYNSVRRFVKAHGLVLR